MTHTTDAPPRRVIIVGAGFAGIHAARRLARLAGHQVEVTLINPTDYFLYLPLLPEVTAGVLDPRRVAASLVTRGYHLLSLPANRVRVASDWVLDAVLPRQSVQFGLVRGSAVPLSPAEPGAPRDFAAVSGGAP